MEPLLAWLDYIWLLVIVAIVFFVFFLLASTSSRFRFLYAKRRGPVSPRFVTVDDEHIHRGQAFVDKEGGRKRKSLRIPVDDYVAEIEDVQGTAIGSVNDVSWFGICLKDLTKKIDVTTDKLFVVISGQGKRFRLSVRPRWQKNQGLYQVVGMELLTFPLEWPEFVLAHQQGY